MKPTYIGIVGKHIANSNITYLTSSMVRDEISQALMSLGATPIGIPLPTHYSNSEANMHLPYESFPENELKIVNSYLDLCSGIIFQGGKHIDDYEYELARLAYQRNLPTLGFCSGQTAMVSALIPNVRIINVSPKVHDLPGENHAHEIQIIPMTKFASIIQADRIFVNSRHQTCITSLPPEDTNWEQEKAQTNLHISALGPEGYAEVIEDSGKKFYLSTRFHPESNLEDENMKKIFEAFIATCQGTV